MSKKNINLESLRLSYEDPMFGLPNSEEVLEWFTYLQAGWIHGGGLGKPHAKLHSGKCSNGYFLCKKVLSRGNLREILAACIIKELRKAGPVRVSGVFGSPYSSLLLAGDVGRLLGVKTYVPEKDPTDPNGKRMIFKPDDPIPQGSVLLQVEELVTTWESGGATSKAIIAGNPNPICFFHLVGTLVHRPPEITRELPDGRKIAPFIERKIDAWDPVDCPLCKAGSTPVPPKTHWAQLTG